MSQTSEANLYEFCQKVAHRYKSTQEYGDLVSEGYLAALECLSEGGTEDQATGVARKAMHYYMANVGSPVRVPEQSQTDMLVADIRRGEDLSKYSQLLVAAIRGESVDVTPNTLKSDSDPEADYMQKELEENLRSVLYFWLDKKECCILHRLFFEEVPPQELADELGITRQGLHYLRDNALYKLKKYLTEGK